MTAFHQRFLRLTKIAVLIAAAWTACCAVVLLAVGIISWLRADEWASYPLSSILVTDRTYSLASSREVGPGRVNMTDQMLEWVLGLPAILPLLVALIALLTFWMRLSKLERGAPRTSTDGC